MAVDVFGPLAAVALHGRAGDAPEEAPVGEVDVAEA